MQSGTIDGIVNEAISHPTGTENSLEIANFEVILDRSIRTRSAAERILKDLEDYATWKLRLKQWDNPYDLDSPLFLTVKEPSPNRYRIIGTTWKGVYRAVFDTATSSLYNGMDISLPFGFRSRVSYVTLTSDPLVHPFSSVLQDRFSQSTGKSSGVQDNARLQTSDRMKDYH